MKKKLLLKIIGKDKSTISQLWIAANIFDWSGLTKIKNKSKVSFPIVTEMETDAVRLDIFDDAGRLLATANLDHHYSAFMANAYRDMYGKEGIVFQFEPGALVIN